MSKKTLVVGASPNPARYSYKAVQRLRQKGHETYAFGFRNGEIEDVQISKDWPSESFDTITLYLNPTRQIEYAERILKINPKRVIFNPGTENPEFQDQLTHEGVEVEVACTLVMLGIGNY